MDISTLKRRFVWKKEYGTYWKVFRHSNYDDMEAIFVNRQSAINYAAGLKRVGPEETVSIDSIHTQSITFRESK